MTTTSKLAVASTFALVALALSTLTAAPASAGPGAGQIAPCPWASGHQHNALMPKRQCDAIKGRVIRGAGQQPYRPGRVQTQPSGLPSRTGSLGAAGSYQPGMGTSVNARALGPQGTNSPVMSYRPGMGTTRLGRH